MRVKRRERLLCNDRGRCSRESLSFPGNDWAHLAAQGNNLLIAIGRGVQFLTRSHRTALSEQTGPVPRVITISFSSKTPYTVLVFEFRFSRPRGRCDDDSFVNVGEFCQTPLVPPRGIEPLIFRVKGGCVKPIPLRWHISFPSPSFIFKWSFAA